MDVIRILSSLKLGDYRYIETTKEGYPGDMRKLSPDDKRLCKSIRGRKYTRSIYTAIPGKLTMEVKYLIRIERTK